MDYTYTGRSQLDTIIAGGTTVANYGYYRNGNIYQRALDNGTSSSYGHDAMDRTTSISHALAGVTRTFSCGYNSVGNRNWVKCDGANGDLYDYDLEKQVGVASNI